MMQSKSLCIGICSDAIETRALLRRAADDLGCSTQSIDLDNAFRWLSGHKTGVLLLDAACADAENLHIEWARGAPGEGGRVLLLTSGPVRSRWPASLERPRTADRPTDFEQALAIVHDLKLEHGKGAAPKQKPAAAKPAEGREPRPQSSFDISDETYVTAKRLAQYPVDMLLCGETGSGKDSLARYIYEQSGCQGCFVPVNCAAIPEGLAESELFGHEAGAFTGAVRARAGKVEEADQGVLYLDEVDSCPLWLQAKLLRVLQDKGCERVGSSKFRRSDFRLIASTKADLPTMVQEGAFRQDLYFRLRIIELRLAPIRTRPDRLQMIFQRFVQEASQQFQIPARPVDATTLSWLIAHHWPGNLRELKAAATRYALSMASPASAMPSEKISLRTSLDACERGLLMSALARANGNMTRASDELCLPLNTLYYRLKRLGIKQRSGVPRFQDSRQ